MGQYVSKLFKGFLVAIPLLGLASNDSRAQTQQVRKGCSEQRPVANGGWFTSHQSDFTLINSIEHLERGIAYVSVRGLAWSPDGSKLAAYIDVGGEEIRVWRRDGAVVRTIKRQGDYEGESLGFINGGNSLVAAPTSSDRVDLAFKVYNLDSGLTEMETLGAFSAGPLRLNAVGPFALSPDRKTLAAITAPMRTQPVRLYREPTWTKRTPLPESVSGNTAVTAVSFSHDGRLLAVARMDGNVLIYSLLTNTVIQHIEAFGPKEHISADSLDFSKDDRSIYIGAGIAHSIPLGPDGNAMSGGRETLMKVDDALRVFNIETGNCTGALTRLQQPIRKIRTSPLDGTVMFTDNAYRLYEWHPDSTKPASMLLMRRSEILDIEFSPDGQSLALAEINRISFFSPQH